MQESWWTVTWIGGCYWWLLVANECEWHERDPIAIIVHHWFSCCPRCPIGAQHDWQGCMYAWHSRSEFFARKGWSTDGSRWVDEPGRRGTLASGRETFQVLSLAGKCSHLFILFTFFWVELLATIQWALMWDWHCASLWHPQWQGAHLPRCAWRSEACAHHVTEVVA